ncbi:MAG TPA: SDR family NAD(P)-dependent oxidoreductase [Hanamia sp.]|nr:SDR family NAD(P)-dependent oxidoreductase [Hanamia sp.]
MLTKTAIITGASGNLGQAVVKKFIDKNYNIIGTIHNKQEQKNYKEKNVEEVELDLLDEENCQKFVEGIIMKNKAIDVAVLTAGGFAMGNIAKTKTSDIAKQYQLNFETAYNIARPVFLQMIKQNSGRIFLIGSRQGLDILKGKGALAYTFSKSLLFHLAELLNAEAKGKNVVVSVIVPSIIDTPQNRKSMPGEDYSAWVSPSQIADVIYFYSSEEGSVIREPVIKIYNNS